MLSLTAIALGLALWRRSRAHEAFRRQLAGNLGARSSSESALVAAADARRLENTTAVERIARLESALDISTVGIAIVDGDGNEVFTNRAARVFSTGSGGDAVVGMRLRELLTEAAASEEPIEQEIEVFTPSPRTLRLSGFPLTIGDERQGTVAFTDDLTPQSHVDTIRRDFVANASHELKTPLGALRLLAEALVATSDETTRKSLSERVQTEAMRMTRLVDDILDLSLIEQHQSVRGVVEVCNIVADSIQQAELVADTLAVPITSTCEPVEVIGDRRRLVSAVANLIENAITYTAAKGEDQNKPVEVRARRVGATAVIEVEDHGIGIAARHLPRVFERFYRIDKGRSRASGGTGLGLAIVRHVVENHWGEVEVESVPGQRTTFRIVLPARES